MTTPPDLTIPQSQRLLSEVTDAAPLAARELLLVRPAPWLLRRELPGPLPNDGLSFEQKNDGVVVLTGQSKAVGAWPTPVTVIHVPAAETAHRPACRAVGPHGNTCTEPHQLGKGHVALDLEGALLEAWSP